jgi:hypothetical protein
MFTESLSSPSYALNARAFVAGACRLCLLILLACAPASAQQKLPSPEKIVGEYVKALGGKKRVAALRDASQEWDVSVQGQTSGSARTWLKAPASARADLLIGGGEMNAAANERAAWERAGAASLRTLTDREALAAKLRAALEAGRLVDVKKQKILARTVASESVEGRLPTSSSSRRARARACATTSTRTANSSSGRATKRALSRTPTRTTGRPPPARRRSRTASSSNGWARPH